VIFAACWGWDAPKQAVAKIATPRFALDELQAFRLSLVHQKTGTQVKDGPYHKLMNSTTLGKRLVEHARMLFFKENLVEPLPFGQHGRLGLTYEAYKLALTKELLDAVYDEPAGKHKIDQAVDGATTARDKLNNPTVSGYLSGPLLADRFKDLDTNGQYWIRSGIAGFAPDATQHFYLPEQYTDPFDNSTMLEYERDLFVKSSADPMGNKAEVKHFDFRVLAPREMKDINENLSEVIFDVLGLPTAMAVKGKGNEGDNLSNLTDANLHLDRFCCIS
jgi:hypothetical protein